MNTVKLISKGDKVKSESKKLIDELEVMFDYHDQIITNLKEMATLDLIDKSLSLIVAGRADKVYQILKSHISISKFTQEQRSELIARLIFRVSDLSQEDVKQVDRIIELLLHEGLEREVVA